MTTQRLFKRRVRERMGKTGESYTAARRMLIARGERPGPEMVFEPPVSDEAVKNATGHGWAYWLAVLDEWGAASRTHTQIARWLVDEHGVSGWWSQSVTLGYQRARGLRAPGQHADGFRVNVTKIANVPIEQLFDAFVDEAARERWLPGAALGLRTATSPKTARYDWEDGTTRVHLVFDPLGPAKSRVSLSHERLPDADTAEEMKLWWRERLVALKTEVER